MQHLKKSVKLEVWRGRKSKKISVWRCLGGSWRVLGGCGAIWEDFFGDIGAKMGATWAKLEYHFFFKLFLIFIAPLVLCNLRPFVLLRVA